MLLKLSPWPHSAYLEAEIVATALSRLYAASKRYFRGQVNQERGELNWGKVKGEGDKVELQSGCGELTAWARQRGAELPSCECA